VNVARISVEGYVCNRVEERELSRFSCDGDIMDSCAEFEPLKHGNIIVL
jgi:hypothetical protein